ncbi:hypothetical protein P305_08590 [Xylella fastidiosa subsp. fastidiosa Mus-1]|nr:hypothetical protein P303_10415 [Xylella fastidiosa MUL0034]KAF0571895.1 hypothetical protein P305_08590 [Xylella fastidiosa subsp. fastidiosa Mus-1]
MRACVFMNIPVMGVSFDGLFAGIAVFLTVVVA